MKFLRNSVFFILVLVVLTGCARIKTRRELSKWNKKGLFLASKGNYTGAVECYDKAIELDPSFYPAWCNKGLALYYLNKNDEAIKCLDQAIEKIPNVPKPGIIKGWS